VRSLQKQIGTAWISRKALESLSKEFRISFPNETGGVLIGYWLGSFEGAVITDAVGPGPCSYHDEISFVPDGSYHESEIARLYEQSRRKHTYLGDWHSHPKSTTRLSLADRKTLVRIAKHSDARVPSPLMAIIADANPIRLQVWRYFPGGMFGLKRAALAVLQLQEFS
jgi:integrative and conjugative element protein (TIGR02256 family)